MNTSDILDFVKKHGGKLFNDNFLGVYPIDKITDIIPNIENKNYPLCIFNTDVGTSSGTHWIVTNIINEKKPSFFIFDSFGRLGLQTFFIQDDYDIIKLFVSNIKKSITSTDSDQNFDFFKWTVHCEKYFNLPNSKKSKLSSTCTGFINLLMTYLKYHNKVHDKKYTSIDMYGLTDQLQDINKTTCGLYALYYSFNLFNPHESFNFENEKGDMQTIKKLINNIFVDTPYNSNNKNDINFEIVKQFKEAFGIEGDLQDRTLLSKQQHQN